MNNRMTAGDESPRRRRPEPPPTLRQQAERYEQWALASKDIIDLRADLNMRFPDQSTAELDTFIATLVIGNNLGEDWVARHIDGECSRRRGNSYLRTAPANLMERHEHYLRIMELARRIFELGQESFANLLNDNLRQRDLEGAAFEADVVRMLVALPRVALDLRPEHGTKTDDYDIDVWLGTEQRWSIEVKTRAESSPYSAKALARTLGRARSQLPPDGVGTIFMKVPTPWLGEADYRYGHADTVMNMLRNTSRVHAVVLVWDQWTLKPSGHGFNWKRGFRIFRANRIDELVGRLLDFYEQIWKGPWDAGPTAPF